MFLSCRAVFSFILPLFFVFKHVTGNSGCAVQWDTGFRSNVDSPLCQETGPPLCLKLQRRFSSECVSYGKEMGWLAVHSRRGPSIHNATVAALIDRLQIGKPLLLEVSGIPNLSRENISMVFIFSGNSGPCALHNTSGMANRSFTCYIEAILPAAGLYQLNVTVTNSIHSHSASWLIRVWPSGTDCLNLMLSTKDQDIPFCAPLPTDTEDKQQEKASTKFKQAVWIFSDKHAYATQTDISFVAMTEGPDPLYFYWRFGDGPEIKRTSRIFKKRYDLADRYNVTVSVSYTGLPSISSDVYPVVIQRSVQPNRLLFSPSVLLNSSVIFTCWISSGTDVSYVWHFGDGTEKNGSSTEHHVFNRTGEYIIEVTLSNLVSSASLKGHIFVVEESCQPPPVKNMGPNKIQVWRYQDIRLSVTFEAEIECNVSRDLLYRWSILDMSGGQLLLPHTVTGRQYIDLPKYLFHYGTYRAVAKVRVVGTVVYSNYSVLIEVMQSLPVSIISQATNIFINRHSGINVTLDGRKSHDPDYPNNTIRFSWSCRPASTDKSSCFNKNITSTSAVLSFPALALKPDFDLLKFTLTVSSGHRSASSEIFITVTSKHVSNIHISWKDCRENSVNWNEQFLVSALCEDCGFYAKNVTYYWKLYLVNASSKVVTEVPFCSSMDFGLPSKESLRFSRSVVTPYTPRHFPEPSVAVSPSPYLSDDADLTAPATPHTQTAVKQTKHRSVHTLNTFPAIKPSHTSFLPSFNEETESSGGHWESSTDSVALTDVVSDLYTEDMIYTDIYESISGDHLSLPDYDYYNFGIEEADPGVPVGRPTGTDSVGLNWDVESFPHSYEDEGDNLVDPNLLVPMAFEKTLLDLDRELLPQSVFQSYTLTGLSSSVVTFKPFMLKPKSLYLLEVSARCEERLRGKSQLFFHTQAVPEGMICQVQPNTGSEIHTHFSVFCSSGKQDLLYEYSFSVGNTGRKLLYKGRDFQHYFSLPRGDPNDDYKVTIYIEIKNRFGAATKPCPVMVTVQPSFQRNSSSQLEPDRELYMYGVGNLTSLSKTGSSRDVINYIYLLTAVLNRLSLDPESSVQILTLSRSAFISAVCQLTIADKGVLFDIIHSLSDLIRISSQVTFHSANQVIQYVHNISCFLHGTKAEMLDSEIVKALVSFLSGVLEIPVLSSRLGHQLKNKVLYTITDLVLERMLSSNASQYNVNTTLMELLAWKQNQSHSAVKTLALTTFHLTDFLQMQFQQWSSDSKQKPCVITWLSVHRTNPYHQSRAIQFSGETADIRLYNCTTKKEVKVRHLSRPIIIEFQRKEKTNQSRHTDFSLLRSRVNIHQFNITSQMIQRAVQITVSFTRPSERPFPVLLLLRMYEQPTPELYNKQEIYHWKGQTAHIFLPQSYFHATAVYVMLLNADYNKKPSNKYITRAVNYTLSVESVNCLSWDGVKEEWKTRGCLPHASVSPHRIFCSCNHLASFAVSHENILNNFSSADVSQFIQSKTNYIPMILSVIFLAVHVVVLLICRKADVFIQKTIGSFFLQENNPSDCYFYAITIDTGFRSRSRMTAKVHIVLYGDDGVSQTRELSSSDSKLFTCNSRNTFILSCPTSLGRVWKVHVWHDNGGSSPSWYLSHVVVKDLVQGTCWFFMGQCWLAVDEGDGKVERTLAASECGLTFKQLTEYLKDFHPWLSLYSRPSFSSFTHTQRSSVCLLLLQGYMCVSAALINLLEEQCFLEMGLIDVSAVSMVTGVCSVLAVMPVGGLVSLVFRVSKATSSSVSGEQYKITVPNVHTVEDDCDAVLMNDCPFEWNRVSYWSHGSCKKENKLCQDWKTLDAKLQEDPDTILEIDDSISDVPNRVHDKCKWKKSVYKSHASAEKQQTCNGRIRTLQSWCYYVGWTLCWSLTITCSIISATLGVKFTKTETLLWAHSLFFSLVCCGFVLHPAVVNHLNPWFQLNIWPMFTFLDIKERILIFAIIVSLFLRKRPDWFYSQSVTQPVLTHMDQKNDVLSNKYQKSTGRSTHFEKVLAARQRARYLRLVRPPDSTDLKRLRGRIKKQTLLHKNARDLMLHLFMLSAVVFVIYGKYDSDQKFNLNQAIKSHFTKGPQNSFLSIQKHNDWWNWTTTTFLERLYNNPKCHDEKIENETGHFRGHFPLIGSPVISKIKSKHNSSCQVLNLLGKNHIKCPHYQSVAKRHSLCGKHGCYEGESVSVILGKTRSKAFKSIKRLLDTSWMTPFTQIVMVQFTVYNGPSNLFASVSILVEKISTGALMPSARVQSTKLYHFPAALDYSIMSCEMLLLLFTLFHIYWQIYVMVQRGWLYWRNLWSWLEITVIICSLLRYVCSVYNFILKTEVIDFLQKEDFQLPVDLSPIFFCEQLSQSLLGVTVNLLLLKCVFLLRINKTVAAAVANGKLIFSNLIWLLAAGVVMALALSGLRNLIFHSFPFTSITKSAHLFFTHYFCMSHLSDISQIPSALYFGAIFCTVIPLKAMVIATISIFVNQKKSDKKSEHSLSVFELISYVKETALQIFGKASHISTDHQSQTNSFYLTEFEDLVDELLFHLCTMSESHKTLATKENLCEIQSNFSFPLLDHVYDSDKESVTIDRDCIKQQPNRLGKKHKGSLDVSSASFILHKENTHRLPIEHTMSQYLQQGRERWPEEILSREQRNFRNRLKDAVGESEETGQPHILYSSKQTYCAPAEWKGIVSSTLFGPSRTTDEHSNVLKTQIINHVKKHTVLTHNVNMGCTINGRVTEQENVFNALHINGKDIPVEEQTVFPGFTEQCM